MRDGEGAAVRAWFRQCCALREYLAPAFVPPIRDKFLGIPGRRARRLGLPDGQKRVVMSRGTDFRAAPKAHKRADPEVLAQARDRDEAIDLPENEKRRLQ